MHTHRQMSFEKKNQRLYFITYPYLFKIIFRLAMRFIILNCILYKMLIILLFSLFSVCIHLKTTSFLIFIFIVFVPTHNYLCHSFPQYIPTSFSFEQKFLCSIVVLHLFTFIFEFTTII